LILPKIELKDIGFLATHFWAGVHYTKLDKFAPFSTIGSVELPPLFCQ